MVEFDGYTPAALFARLTQDGTLERVLRAARDEDLGERGDVTTASIVPESLRSSADLVARGAGVVAGLAAIGPMTKVFGAPLEIEVRRADGDACAAGLTLARLSGPLAAMLTMERTLLNLVGRMSGIATLTRRFVDAVRGTRAEVCATRKTAPGLRALDKYAVCCGGGRVHRQGLSDAALYKDNHLAGIPPDHLARTLASAIRVARAGSPLRFVEVEVDSLTQLRAVMEIEAGLVDIVLLDNMDPEGLRACVAARDGAAPGIRLEASGGVTLESAREVAETGVDRVSIGALTHSASSLDVALDVARGVSPDAV